MASVASSGASPLSGYEYSSNPDQTSDEENIWQFINSAGPSSVDFFPSPASGSLGSWQMVGGQSMQPSPPALSPLNLDYDAQAAFTESAYTNQAAQFPTTSAAVENTFLPTTLPEGALDFGLATSGLAPTGLLFSDPQFNVDAHLADLSPAPDFSAFFQFPATANTQQVPQQAFHTPDFGIPPQLQTRADLPTWETTNSKAGDSPIFVMEDPSMHGYATPSPVQRHSPSVSPPSSASPRSPILQIKLESGMSEFKMSTPIAIRKVQGSARVQKKKSPTDASSNLSLSSSGGSSSGGSKFLIVTPDSVTAHAGKPNPYECFDAMRQSQRGRKGPLANATKESALLVRRLGACFCCHARKVKCDKERPCRNCTKLTMAVPQVVCWQFQDFLPVLFPGFIRSHFKKEEMSKFLSENIEGFKVDGVEKPCIVELFSGPRFSTTLSIQAKFFTAKTPEVLRQWYLNVGANEIDMQFRGAAPIGLDTDPSSQRDEIRKKAKEYIASILREPQYADQLTDSLRHTELPRKVLRIVQNYSYRTDAPIVKRALSIYAMHYVMTHHLTMTKESIMALASSKLVAQDAPWLTPRVLNRQIKAVIDEMLMREMQQLFESFSKSLKPKSRKQWAPCLAAFLVLCLFMEAVETTAENFVMSENEIALRDNQAAPYKRAFALDITREVENLPFKQFAYQFHQIYQTHSKDVSTKSFNPIDDDASFEQAELDQYSMEMVWQLRKLVREPQHCEYSPALEDGDLSGRLTRFTGSELDYLSNDAILNDTDEHPYPKNATFLYTGRLVAKFLLSFTDEKYIFGPTT